MDDDMADIVLPTLPKGDFAWDVYRVHAVPAEWEELRGWRRLWARLHGRPVCHVVRWTTVSTPLGRMAP